MAYDAPITRQNPAYFIFLVDQSGSMEDPQGGNEAVSKAASVADAINRLLNTLVIQCSKGDGVRDYFGVSVVGYGNDEVRSPLLGALAGQSVVSPSQLDANPARIESRTKKIPDGAGGLVDVRVNVPVYFDPVAGGSTPMCKALHMTYQLCEWWVGRYPDAFPPIVLNMTDGEATDGDPAIGARRLTSLATTNGNALLFNIHVSSLAGRAQLYPASDAALSDDFARRLFSMSSLLPEKMLQDARQLDIPVQPGARGFVFNADMVSLVQFLEIGTKPSNFATAALR
jgi:hypothetical protein